MTGTTLILGATGGLGGGVARELLTRGRPVRIFARDRARAEGVLAGAGGPRARDIVEGDVLDLESLRRAAFGCSAIVHGVNFPYPLWDPHMQRATANVVAAARASGARILFPGNVYGLGAQTGASLGEHAANRPTTRKGALRVRLEEALDAAAVSLGIGVIVLRAGDYFGPTVRNGLVDRIFGRAAAGRSMSAFGNLDAPHQWAYVPDLAGAAADLLEIEGALRPLEVYHFAGHVAPSQRDFLRQVAEAAGRPDVAIHRVSWTALRIAGIFDPVVRELLELRYLFDGAVVLDGAKLRRTLPHLRETPLAEALRATVASYG